MESTTFLQLSEAVARYGAAGGSCSTYETVRGHAARSGSVHLGVTIAVHKEKGRWVVDAADSERGISAERQRRAEQSKRTADYEDHVLHGASGERVGTDWGWYERKDGFHFAHHSSVPPWDSLGDWYCSTCWARAKTEHKNPECHTCSDGGSCQHDCTLSAVKCDLCGVVIRIKARFPV